MLSFDIAGSEKQTFTFLNNLKLIKLAVSPGGTESLPEYPAAMTHIDIPDEEKIYFRISLSLIRLLIGVENYQDIIWEIEQALAKVKSEKPELYRSYMIIPQTAANDDLNASMFPCSIVRWSAYQRKDVALRT